MSAVLRSAEIDIDNSFVLEVQDAQRPEDCDLGLRWLKHCQRHRQTRSGRKNDDWLVRLMIMSCTPYLHGLALLEAGAFGLGHGQRRDVVQRGLDRSQMRKAGGTMPHRG